MRAKILKVVLPVLVLGAGAAFLVTLHRANAQLRHRVADRRQQAERVQRLRADTQQSEKLLISAETGAADGARAIHADLVRAREEVEALEQRAGASRVKRLAQTAADAEALERNRDPEKALMRLEHFQNTGRAAPGAAFQTLVWAATKGEEAELWHVVGLTPEARAKAEALIAKLPEAERAQWSAERVGGMFLTALLNEVPAVQILGVNPEAGGEKAMLEIRLPQPSNREATQRVPLQHFADGWKVMVAEGQIERVRRKIQGEETAATPK